MSQDWSRLEEDDLTLQLLRRWPSRTEDGCPRPGSRLDEARRGSGLGTVSVENAHNTGLADGPLLCAHGIKRQEQQIFRGASDDRIA